MKRTFQKWLFIFVSVAFVITLCLSIAVQSQLAYQNAYSLIKLKLRDVEEQLATNQKNLDSIRELNNKAALSKARAFSSLLADNPTLESDTEELIALCARLDVDELHIIDGNGIIVGSSKPDFVGYDMRTQAQSRFFLPLLDDASLELVQEPQAIGFDSRIVRQYAGVARLDATGFVQIGYTPERLQEAIALADIRKLAPGLRIGNAGGILVCDAEGIILSAENRQVVGKSLEECGMSPERLSSEIALKNSFLSTPCLAISQQTEGYTLVGMMPQSEVYVSRENMVLILTVCNVFLFLVVFALVSYLIKLVIIDGIYKINASLAKITAGDLNEKVLVRTNEEFVALSDGINHMVDALKHLIAEAAARIDEELELARNIQLTSLPLIFPPYPGHDEFDIYASMKAAREIGGDFYDFFIMGGNKLVFVIADVSGKGIPAAMFMMRARAAIKNTILASGSLREGIVSVNEILCESNETNMFVTAFVGMLDLREQTLNYVNAGHNLPLLYQDGCYTWLESEHRDFILGAMPDRCYTEHMRQLHSGDKLFVFTDGVTEALNGENELYSNARLLALMNSEAMLRADAQTQVHLVGEDVAAFASGTPQADDITMLALHIHGKLQ